MVGELVGRKQKRPERGVFIEALAETKGFEPLMRLNTPYSLSRGAPSATRSRFQWVKLCLILFQIKRFVQ